MDATLKRANKILGTNYHTWIEISHHRGLTEDFIREFKNEVNWNFISCCQHLSEDFIREFQYEVNWDYIAADQQLSEDFIREFADRVDWEYISIYQHLSEDFIGEFMHRIDWCLILKYQHLSENFLRKSKGWVHWGLISRYQRLSKEFIEEFKDKLDTGFIADSWHYKSVEEKKKAVINTGLYECHENYFIAYKGIRRDRYSRFNFQYQYFKGETYETWCDCSDNEDSFGFSAWTEESVKQYCSELVVRVKVRYEDVGRVVHDDGKIRCFKIEILD